ncbi:hypothetical protein GGX14DRAFT_404377 [Mycena pura]|uniref:Uncharacterized protein n=1 Tax=Mycena pura TaxID=153505 RepID=A0AAD6UXV8_9AGAR|nr:hypothetical protein GGX14DRAFT_404377 [Mycena pura]
MPRLVTKRVCTGCAATGDPATQLALLDKLAPIYTGLGSAESEFWGTSIKQITAAITLCCREVEANRGRYQLHLGPSPYTAPRADPTSPHLEAPPSRPSGFPLQPIMNASPSPPFHRPRLLDVTTPCPLNRSAWLSLSIGSQGSSNDVQVERSNVCRWRRRRGVGGGRGRGLDSGDRSSCYELIKACTLLRTASSTFHVATKAEARTGAPGDATLPIMEVTSDHLEVPRVRPQSPRVKSESCAMTTRHFGMMQQERGAGRTDAGRQVHQWHAASVGRWSGIRLSLFDGWGH